MDKRIRKPDGGAVLGKIVGLTDAADEVELKALHHRQIELRNDANREAVNVQYASVKVPALALLGLRR